MFRQFAPEYLAYSQANKSHTSNCRDQVAVEHWLILMVGDRFLFQITVAEVERYNQERLETVSPSTVNKELNCLKAMLNKAVAWRYLGMKGLEEPPGRLHYLAPEETAQLLAACETPAYLRPIVELAIEFITIWAIRCLSGKEAPRMLRDRELPAPTTGGLGVDALDRGGVDGLGTPL